MEKNVSDMHLKELGFWARLKSVLSPLPPPVITGVFIGFEDDKAQDEEAK